MQGLGALGCGVNVQTLGRTAPWGLGCGSRTGVAESGCPLPSPVLSPSAPLPVSCSAKLSCVRQALCGGCGALLPHAPQVLPLLSSPLRIGQDTGAVGTLVPRLRVTVSVPLSADPSPHFPLELGGLKPRLRGDASQTLGLPEAPALVGEGRGTFGVSEPPLNHSLVL